MSSSAIIASQRSSGNSSTGATCWKPAFGTTTSRRPKRSSAAVDGGAVALARGEVGGERRRPARRDRARGRPRAPAQPSALQPRGDRAADAARRAGDQRGTHLFVFQFAERPAERPRRDAAGDELRSAAGLRTSTVIRTISLCNSANHPKIGTSTTIADVQRQAAALEAQPVVGALDQVEPARLDLRRQVRAISSAIVSSALTGECQRAVKLRAAGAWRPVVAPLRRDASAGRSDCRAARSVSVPAAYACSLRASSSSSDSRPTDAW